MKSLDQHNQQRREEHEAVDRLFNQPRRNGIACPRCGKELWDSCPATTLTSNPPQKNIHCECGYTGYRVA
jgi:hypothetical protein